MRHRLATALILLATLGLVLAPSRAVAAEDDGAPQITTAYIVRHAEKVAGEYPRNDHPLTDKGHARARALASMLRSVDLAAIYTTKWQRNRDTVAPSAELLGLEPIEYASGYEAEDVIPEVLQHHRGRCVLIAGHFDTVGLIIEDFGAEPNFELTKSDYDGLYVVTVVHLDDGSHHASVQRLHFEPWEPSQGQP